MRNLAFDELVLNNGLKIYYKQTKDFRKTTIKAKIVAPVTENLSALHVLGNLKVSVNRKYDDMKKFSLELRKNYNSAMSFDIFMRKNLHFTFINLETLVKDYFNKGVNPLKKSLEVLGDSLSTNTYDENLINLFSIRGIENLEYEKRDSSGYTKRKLLERCYPKSTLLINEFGNKDEFKSLNNEILETTNKEFYNSDNITLFLIGDVKNFDSYLDPFNDLNRGKKNKLSGDFDFSPTDNEFIEYENIEQSYITSAFRIKGVRFFNRNYLMWNLIAYIYNNMLYDEVREKNSLSYVVYGYLSGELLLASAGFDKKNYKKVRDLIIKNGKRIKEGDFTKEQFEQAKGEEILYLKKGLDNPYSIISNFDAFNDYNKLNSLYNLIGNTEEITYDKAREFCNDLEADKFISYTRLPRN